MSNIKALAICEKHSLMNAIKNVYDKISFVDDIEFVALHGHILTLCTPEDYDTKYKTWDNSLLPILPEKWKYLETDKTLIKTIKEKIKNGNYDYLINATDAEREGQNIFYSVYDHLNLNLPVKRIWLNDLNFTPIKNAIENMRDDLNEPFLKHLTQASKIRAQSDWLVGMNFTRATGMRIGRVKTPTLELLYKRELEIQNYQEKIVYRPKTKLPFEMNNDTEFQTKEECDKFISDTFGTKTDGVVKLFEEKTNKKYAPLLFSLGELQSEANKAFGYTLEETLNIAQSLYENKITTYPRTDCPYLTTYDAARIPGMIDLMKNVAEYTDQVPFNKVPSRYVDDSKVQAHGAIMLTGTNFNKSNLNVGEQKIVTLIAKRMLATLMDPMVTQKTKAEVEINGYLFKGEGNFISDKGYNILYTNKASEDKRLPKLKVGDVITCEDFIANEIKSKKPARYNDSSLIKAMINIGNTLDDASEKSILKGTGDQGGIGTPATRANIVESLLKPSKKMDANSMWVKRVNKDFVVTPLGMSVASKLCDYSFASASLTATWERKLSEIIDGTCKSEDYYKEIIEYIKKEVDALKQNNNVSSSKFQTRTLENCTCPKCGAKVLVTKNYYMCENRDDNKTCDFILKKEFNGANISEDNAVKFCNGMATTPLKMYSSSKGTNYTARIRFNKESSGIDFVFENTKANTSPLDAINCSCGGRATLKNGPYCAYYECDKCKTRISEVFAGHKFTKQQISDLYNHRKVKAEFKSSKAGSKKFTASAFINSDGKIEFEFKK